MAQSLESYIKRYYTIGWRWKEGYSAQIKETAVKRSVVAKHLPSETAGWKKRSEMMDFLKSKVNEVVSNLEGKAGLA